MLFNPMVVVTDETEVERLLKVQLSCLGLCLGDNLIIECSWLLCRCDEFAWISHEWPVCRHSVTVRMCHLLHVQAEHKLVESAWPTSMRNLLGPNSILTAGKQQHKQQRQILSQVWGWPIRGSCYPYHQCRLLSGFVPHMAFAGLFWYMRTHKETGIRSAKGCH